MKLKNKVSVILYCSLLLIFFLIIGFYYFNKNSFSERNMNDFIEKENLNHVSIQKLSNKEYYIFSPSHIFIYRGPKDYNKSTTSNRNGILIGGLQKGYLGLIINNPEVVKYGNTYSIIIDGKARDYQYNGEKYLIINDFRIWNPTPEMKILFLNDEGKVIYETDY
jgi:hypothetical protein